MLLATSASMCTAYEGRFRTACNGCDHVAMANTAMGLGVGEHLILNVTQQTFQIYAVVCAGGGGGETHVRAQGRWSCSQTNAVEIPATNDDLVAFGQIKDSLNPDGSISKTVTVTVSSPGSVYDLATGFGEGQNQQILLGNSLWGQIPPPALAEQGVRWVANRVGINMGPDRMHVLIRFADNSSIEANIDLSVLASGTPTTPGAAQVDFLEESAKDAQLKPVVGLNWNPPARLEAPPIVRYPSNGEGFEDLMRSHGFPTRPMWGWGGGSGSGGTRYECSYRWIDENDHSQGSETVCIRYN